MSPRVLDQANTSSNIGTGIYYNYFCFSIANCRQINQLSRMHHSSPLDACSLSFSGSGSRSGSSFKMNNFWTISHYLFKKTWFVYTLTW